MSWKLTGLNRALFTIALLTCWAETVHAGSITVTFASGDQTCALGECVTVNPNTTIQGGHPTTAPNVFVLDGSGPASAFTRENTDWYHPTNGNSIITGGLSLNTFTGLAAHWVSYTDSGANASGLASNPPAVPNYCGTTGPGSPGTIGGNNNPNATPACAPGSFDPTGNQQRIAPDSGRTRGNQTATFTERVSLGAGIWDMEFYAWMDDTAIVEVLDSLGNPIVMDTANPFPALTGLSNRCADMDHAVACIPAAGGKFTALGLSSGTYTLNFYAFQTGSDVFGGLWGGVFTDLPAPVLLLETMPEPSTIILLGAGLAGLGLLQWWRKAH